MSRPRSLLSLCLVLPCLSAGCHLLTRIDNPVANLEEVSLVPVIAEDLERTVMWTDSLRNNLLRVEGVDRVVVTPYPDVEAAQPVPATLPMARSSQALLEVKLLSFDPHYPPSASVEVLLYVPGTAEVDAESGVHMDQLGRPPESDRTVVARHRMSFMLPFRAEDPTTAMQVRLYALAQMDDDRGFDAADRILRSSERFIDFVAFQTVKECFARLEEVRAGR